MFTMVTEFVPYSVKLIIYFHYMAKNLKMNIDQNRTPNGNARALLKYMVSEDNVV